MTDKDKVIAVAGASTDTSKYWYKIYKDTKAYGYKTYCINSRLGEVDGEKLYHDLTDVQDKIDALVLVVPPQLTTQLVEQAIKLKVKEIWFQPGTFNEQAAELAQKNGMEVHDTCFMLENSIW